MNLRRGLIFRISVERALYKTLTDRVYNFNTEYILTTTNNSVIRARYSIKNKLEKYEFTK